MKKRKIIFNITIGLIIIFLLLIPNYSRAEGLSWSEISNSADDFLQQGQNQDTLDEEKIQNIVIPIAQILVTVGNVVVVIAVAIMAIKYIMASPENKAKLKTQLIGVVVATVVIFGAQFIWKTMYEFLSNLA